MENPTHNFRFGRCKVGINKFLLPIKISLFCWFAGSQATEVFISVYLKQQGLTIPHLSAMITVGAVFQFMAGITSGMFADRIGRVKPFLFMYGSIFLVTLVCFIGMPKIGGCDAKPISFFCLDDKFTVQDSCQIFRDTFNKDSCCITYTEKATHYDENENLISQDTFNKDSCCITYTEKTTHYDENENCTSASVLLQGDFAIELYHRNETSGSCLYQINFRNYSSEDIPVCSLQKCKEFHLVCSEKNLSTACLKNKSLWTLAYGILFILFNISRSSIFKFFDVIVMDLSNQHNSDFGKQRVWSILGLSVGPLVAGFLSHKMSETETDKNYIPVFVCSAVFTLLAFIPVLKINPKFHKPAPSVWRKSLEFVINLESILFFILLLITGTCFGFTVIYGNWYLQDLGASNLLLGVSAAVSAICGLPFSYWSKWFLDKAGLRNFFVICLLSHTLYSLAFSVMREPWIAVGIQLVSGVSYHAFWVASIRYCDEVSPVELQATIKVLAAALHYNVARLGATAVGGYIMSNFGGRIAYRVVGYLALGYAIIYGTYLIIRRKKIRAQKKKSKFQVDYDYCETKMCMKQNVVEELSLY